MISIFDDSSREGSENSQDDEQFRARKEFLKSGLPESFRKQIAKTAATKEAYSLACSSFQPVTHVKQTPKGRLCSHQIRLTAKKKVTKYISIGSRGNMDELSKHVSRVHSVSANYNKRIH